MAQHDDEFILHALNLAEVNAQSLKGGPFGAVVVRDGQIIAEGVNQVLQDHDPTAHAEIVALRAAGARLQQWHLTGCTLYTSCEPCPMCLGAAYWAHVDRIVFAADRHDAAAVGFDDNALYQEFQLPTDQRRMAMERHQPERGRAVLQGWFALDDKVPY
ncbi:nucleoside deaminase [Marinobacteraceae bacterium S3BR75-40.1]